MSVRAPRLDVTVAEVVAVNDLIKRFRFVRRDGAAMPPFSGGAHVVVDMDDHGTRRMNPYSLMSNPADLSGYEISVRRDDAGRGGSLFLHRHVEPGMRMQISYPVNLFAADMRARKHLLIAGGIGITPFLSMMPQFQAGGQRFELHYSVRSMGLGAYADVLPVQYGDRVKLYCDDQGQTIDLARLLSGQPLGTHLYVCGPKGMIAWVRATADAMGWPPMTVHSEEFLAPPVGQPFRVKLAASDIEVQVGAAQSLLEAIEAAGIDAPYLCRGGACGQCETAVLTCKGHIHHHDHWLSDEDKTANRKIMPCVSRFEGTSLELDR